MGYSKMVRECSKSTIERRTGDRHWREKQTFIDFADRPESDARSPNADAKLAQYAQDFVESSLGPSPFDMSTQVHQKIVTLPGSGRCTIDAVAQTIGISRRTLHRRLEVEGSTFSNIIDAVRRELAIRYIADRRRSLAEISTLLGFSSPSVFSRWYRREFGATASQRRPSKVRRVR